ncbi:unnamed protein product [Miscanthus lutarioriparius]|uniref:Uncharacterized protein n=1 Tax=Miscanthus lutarioriparius TaxID=422564 RepID=A0A811SBB2_9POAL|nr:unnamed protein product [Miscanthus lutarioriparius]CAD6339935.1 unnamed protein product [Miscanthus lutarioriparius]
MAGAGLVPQAIVLALGAGALGGSDALRLLLQLAGRISPAADLAICVAIISLLTAPLLGTMLLARFVLKARAGAGGGAVPAATDLFAQVTAMVSVGAAFVVTACLLVVPGGAPSASRSTSPSRTRSWSPFSPCAPPSPPPPWLCGPAASSAWRVAIVTVAGTMLLVRCSRRARNTAGAGGGAAARTS